MSRLRKVLEFTDAYGTWRARILDVLLVVEFIVAVIVASVTLTDFLTAPTSVTWTYLGASAFLMLLSGGLLWGRERFSYTFRANTFLLLFFAFSVYLVAGSGLVGSGRLFLFAGAMMAGILVEERYFFFWFGLTVVSLGVLAIGRALDIYQPWLEIDPLSVRDWALAAIVYGTLLMAAGSAQTLFARSQVHLIALAQSRTAELERIQQEMARRAQELERSYAEIERRAIYLSATSEVSRFAASILDLETLLEEVAQLISQRFGFYHTGIFLLDPAREWAVLRAVSSEGGRRMLARGHRLRVGRQGIVGYVAATGRPRIALDVGEDAVFFNNPDLPETRSEVGLPLIARGRVIGVLDVQSTVPGAFTQEDVMVLRILADQLAVAIENAILFEETQATLERARRSYSAEVRAAWRKRYVKTLGYRYTRSGTQPLHEVTEALPALTTEPFVDGQNRMFVPLVLAGTMIGVLRLQRPTDQPWRPEEVKFVQRASVELVQALENARLMYESRQRVLQQQTLSRIASQVRASMNPEQILRTAVHELGRALGAQTLAEVRSATDQAVGPSLRVGVLASLTDAKGPVLLQPTLEAAQLAAQEINSRGGLPVGSERYQVLLVVEDDRTNPDASMEAAEKLIREDGVQVIVGPQFSANAIAAGAVAERMQVPLISPMATNPLVTQGRRWVFRVGFLDDVQGAALARFAWEHLHKRRAAVLFDVNNPYNRGIAEAFRQAFEARGGTLVAIEPYTAGKRNFRTNLERIRQSQAEVLLLPNYPEDLYLQTRQVHELGLSITLLGGDTWGILDFTLPELAGACYSHHWNPGVDTPESRAFVALYQQAYGRTPMITAALTYDAMQLIFRAVQEQGSVEPAAIRTGMAGLREVRGVSGLITYAGRNDPLKDVFIMRVQDGTTQVYAVIAAE